MFLSTARVLRIHGPTDWSMAKVGSRSSPACSMAASLGSVSSSPASAQISPVLVSTRSSATKRPRRSARPTSTSVVPPSAILRAARGVSLTSLSATTSPERASTSGSDSLRPRKLSGSKGRLQPLGPRVKETWL